MVILHIGQNAFVGSGGYFCIQGESSGSESHSSLNVCLYGEPSDGSQLGATSCDNFVVAIFSWPDTSFNGVDKRAGLDLSVSKCASGLSFGGLMLLRHLFNVLGSSSVGTSASATFTGLESMT